MTLSIFAECVDCLAFIRELRATSLHLQDQGIQSAPPALNLGQGWATFDQTSTSSCQQTWKAEPGSWSTNLALVGAGVEVHANWQLRGDSPFPIFLNLAMYNPTKPMRV
jgi:hypothetical protein